MHFSLTDIRISDLFTGANVLIGLAFYRKLSIITYQHGLLWRDFEKRKALNGSSEEAV